MGTGNPAADRVIRGIEAGERRQRDHEARQRLNGYAPQLLRAAKRVLEWVDCGCDPSDRSLGALRDVIAAAEGATPLTETEPPTMEAEGETEWLVRIEYRHARRHLAYEVTLSAETDAAAIEAAERQLLQEKPGAAILNGQAVPVDD